MWTRCILIFLLPLVLLSAEKEEDTFLYLSPYTFNNYENNFQYVLPIALSNKQRACSQLTHGCSRSPFNRTVFYAAVNKAKIDGFLKNCTVNDFVLYVQNQKISITKDLVSHVEWWSYDVFWDYVESLPDAHEEVIRFAQHFLQVYESATKRAVCWLVGDYKAGLHDTVKEKLKEHNARYEAQEELLRQQQGHDQQTALIKKQIHQNFVMNYQQIRPLIGTDDIRWKKCIEALHQNPHEYKTHQFNLTKVQQQFCTLNNDQLGTLYGNNLQRHLHQELLDCIETSVPFHTDYLFVSSINLAHESNRAGFVHKATALIDFCYAITDGIVYGTGKALHNTYQSIFHPIDTAIQTVKAAYAVVETLGNVAKIPVELAYYYATDTQQFYTRCDDIYDYNNALYNLAADYLHNTPGPTIVKDATGLITELVLTHKFLQLTTKLCTDFAQKIPALLESCAAEFFEAECVPIGIPGLKIERAQLFAREKQLEKPRYGGNFATAVTELEKELAAVKKMQEFFEERIFGRKLFNYCEKVKGKTYAGKAIYKVLEDVPNSPLKSGFVFYLDSQHMNHLEVFRMQGSKGIAEFVLNFDGQINIAKTNISSFVNRVLKL